MGADVPRMPGDDLPEVPAMGYRVGDHRFFMYVIMEIRMADHSDRWRDSLRHTAGEWPENAQGMHSVARRRSSAQSLLLALSLTLHGQNRLLDPDLIRHFVGGELLRASGSHCDRFVGGHRGIVVLTRLYHVIHVLLGPATHGCQQNDQCFAQ